MSIGEAKATLGLVNDGIEWWRAYRDPIRKQANRFLDAFEAHGIARQQILRVLPTDMEIPPTAFTNANELKQYLTPELLDWAVDFLVLDRSWLDGVGERPHRLVDGYKEESKYSDWFEQRIECESTVHRRLLVWASSDLTITPDPTGYLSIVYVEDHVGFDEGELSCYWSFSDQWPADHKPCIDSMLKVVDIGRSFDILTFGKIIDHKFLNKYEDGQLFAPQVSRRARSIWYPEDFREVKSFATV